MSEKFLSARVFTLTFGLSYALVLFGDYPLFRYYPLLKQFSLQDLAGLSQGPAMTWYGWIATAAVIAAIVTVLVPKRVGDRLPAGLLWIVPVAIGAAAWYREREWFLATVME